MTAHKLIRVAGTVYKLDRPRNVREVLATFGIDAATIMPPPITAESFPDMLQRSLIGIIGLMNVTDDHSAAEQAMAWVSNELEEIKQAYAAKNMSEVVSSWERFIRLSPEKVKPIGDEFRAFTEKEQELQRTRPNIPEHKTVKNILNMYNKFFTHFTQLGDAYDKMKAKLDQVEQQATLSKEVEQERSAPPRPIGEGDVIEMKSVMSSMKFAGVEIKEEDGKYVVYMGEKKVGVYDDPKKAQAKMEWLMAKYNIKKPKFFQQTYGPGSKSFLANASKKIMVGGHVYELVEDQPAPSYIKVGNAFFKLAAGGSAFREQLLEDPEGTLKEQAVPLAQKVGPQGCQMMKTLVWSLNPKDPQAAPMKLNQMGLKDEAAKLTAILPKANELLKAFEAKIGGDCNQIGQSRTSEFVVLNLRAASFLLEASKAQDFVNSMAGTVNALVNMSSAMKNIFSQIGLDPGAFKDIISSLQGISSSLTKTGVQRIVQQHKPEQPDYMMEEDEPAGATPPPVPAAKPATPPPVPAGKPATPPPIPARQ